MQNTVFNHTLWYRSSRATSIDRYRFTCWWRCQSWGWSWNWSWNWSDWRSRTRRGRCIWKRLAEAKVWHRKQSHLRQYTVLSWGIGSNLGIVDISAIVVVAAGIIVVTLFSVAITSTFVFPFTLALALPSATAIKSFVGDTCSAESPFALLDGHYIFRRPREDGTMFTYICTPPKS